MNLIFFQRQIFVIKLVTLRDNNLTSTKFYGQKLCRLSLKAEEH